ncbi:CopD family protein [Candidatus Nitrososphaera sp. FF02]|uniref:CopD family protein n=1 Tax=Candidatus Nitrososphaera sp. FF02 TaxID=3398226 RepID=UPI0039EBEC38
MAVADGLVTWVHLICASIWVGGSIFIAAVAVPVLRSHTKSTEELVGLMVKIGRQFNRVTVPAFAILIATGVYNARGYIAAPDALTGSAYGILLLIKIILVLATVGTYVVHVRTLNAEMERKILSGNAGEVYVKSVRAKVIHLGRIIVILSIAILLLATLLDSGGL